MTNPTGLAEDLKYLKDKYAFSVGFIDSLTASAESARLQIKLYKTNAFSIWILSVLLGIVLIFFAIVCHKEWSGLFAGIIGSITIFHFANLYLRKRRAIVATEKIARYHKLI
jgi:hypothetical protein